MNKSTRQFVQIIPWLLSATVSLIAIIAWGQSYAWHLGSLTAYQFFPLLGLLAFSIMWTHYAVGYLRRTVLRNASVQKYFRYTGYIVLIAIVLHPSILIYSRFRDGYGLPPHSYESYVAPGLGWVTLLGSASLLAFLAFELRRWFEAKNWWRYVLLANDAAMLAIFYHGLRLGSQLQTGWFRLVWYVYGVSLIGFIAWKYVSKLSNRQPKHASVVNR